MEKLPPLGLTWRRAPTAGSSSPARPPRRACGERRAPRVLPLARLPRDDGDESFGAQARVLTRCEHQPFDEVLAAVHSNREAPDIPALLVLERPLFSEDVEPPNSCPLREVHRR